MDKGFLAFIFGIISAVFVAIFSATCVTFVDNYEVGYKFDAITGEVTEVGREGYVITPPLIVRVHTIDTRPMQVCITSSATRNYTGVNERVLNCKLVRFNEKGLKQFVDWHGRDDYSGDKLGNILKAYAYEDAGKTYPFLDVMRELKTDVSKHETKAASVQPTDVDLPAATGGE